MQLSVCSIDDVHQSLISSASELYRISLGRRFILLSGQAFLTETESVIRIRSAPTTVDEYS